MNIFASISSGGVTFQTYIICLLVALFCGALCAFAASYKSNLTKSFIISLILLPAIVETVITMVNGNIGTGVAVAGAFSLVRFRSVPGKAKDIILIFFAMTSGIACAAGYVAIAVVFVLLVSAALIVIMNLKFSEDKTMELRITIPESLEFNHAFDDLFDEYTNKRSLNKVKTTNMGSMYKLMYRIEMKDLEKEKEFIDKLRCRNGNLEIQVSRALNNAEDL